MSLFIDSSSDKNLSNHVTLKVHFKDVTCLKYRRDIFMTWDGFLGKYCGNSLSATGGDEPFSDNIQS